MSIRRILERRLRYLCYRRRLPDGFGSRPIWVSPDARLRFLKPGKGAFDIELLEWANRFVWPGDKVLDIGANVGEFAVAAAHRAGPSGAVLAVEPDPFLSALLQRTVADTQNSDVNLNYLCAAVSRDAGLAEFSIASRGRAANALGEAGSSQMGGVRLKTLVLTTTLDAIAQNWRAPTVVKIDVEGGERMVLEGAGEVLMKHRPLLLLEISREGDAVEKLLRQADYALFDPAVRDFSTALQAGLFNTLAVPKERVGTIAKRGST